jgi:hypothetical protein
VARGSGLQLLRTNDASDAITTRRSPTCAQEQASRDAARTLCLRSVVVGDVYVKAASSGPPWSSPQAIDFLRRMRRQCTCRRMMMMMMAARRRRHRGLPAPCGAERRDRGGSTGRAPRRRVGTEWLRGYSGPLFVVPAVDEGNRLIESSAGPASSTKTPATTATTIQTSFNGRGPWEHQRPTLFDPFCVRRPPGGGGPFRRYGPRHRVALHDGLSLGPRCLRRTDGSMSGCTSRLKKPSRLLVGRATTESSVTDDPAQPSGGPYRHSSYPRDRQRRRKTIRLDQVAAVLVGTGSEYRIRSGDEARWRAPPTAEDWHPQDKRRIRRCRRHQHRPTCRSETCCQRYSTSPPVLPASLSISNRMAPKASRNCPNFEGGGGRAQLGGVRKRSMASCRSGRKAEGRSESHIAVFFASSRGRYPTVPTRPRENPPPARR